MASTLQTLELYRAQNDGYPERLEQLLEDNAGGEPYLSALPVDPWDNPYLYELGEDGAPVLISFGADAAPGGEGEDADLSSDVLLAD